jgi:hypothetical protein
MYKRQPCVRQVPKPRRLNYMLRLEFVIYVAVRCLFGFGAPDAVWRRPRRFARSYLGSARRTSLQVSAEADEPNHGVSPSLVRMFNSALGFLASAWHREPCSYLGSTRGTSLQPQLRLTSLTTEYLSCQACQGTHR